MASSTYSAALKELLYYIASLQKENVSLSQQIATLNTQLALPTGLQKTQKVFNYKGGETYKIYYYNGFYKTCEITIKPKTAGTIELLSDSGQSATLNIFATSLIDGVYYYETNLYVANNGTIQSNFDNQGGGVIQFNRDIISNTYQFIVQKIS